MQSTDVSRNMNASNPKTRADRGKAMLAAYVHLGSSAGEHVSAVFMRPLCKTRNFRAHAWAKIIRDKLSRSQIAA